MLKLFVICSLALAGFLSLPSDSEACGSRGRGLFRGRAVMRARVVQRTTVSVGVVQSRAVRGGSCAGGVCR